MIIDEDEKSAHKAEKIENDKGSLVYSTLQLNNDRKYRFKFLIHRGK